MPNRLIKESICSSDNLNSISNNAEILFYRLIVNCDDYGLLDARSSIIRAKCFPLKLDTISDKDIEDWLNELVKAKLIFLYLVDGKRYLKMTSWEQHQQIRCQKSKYPKPDINCNQMISSDIRFLRNPIQSESESNPNTNMCVSDDENDISDSNDAVDDTPAEIPEEGGAQVKPGKGDYTAEFETFWAHYPRKVEKRGAFRAWKARLKGGSKPEDIIQACINYADYCVTHNTEMQYIKHPATFIGPNRPYEEFVNGIPAGDTPIKKYKPTKNGFNSYDQRHYDMQELERKLLGRDDSSDEGSG